MLLDERRNPRSDAAQRVGRSVNVAVHTRADVSVAFSVVVSPRAVVEVEAVEISTGD